MFVKARKALVSIAAFVGVLISLGILHGTAQVYTVGIITAANAALVYWIPNGKKVPAVDDYATFAALMEQNSNNFTSDISTGEHSAGEVTNG